MASLEEQSKMPRLTVRDFAGHIDAVETYLESGKYPPDSSMNARRAIRRSAVNNYKREGGILYYRTHRQGVKKEEGNDEELCGPWREVVKTEDERQLILAAMHCSGERGHLGRDKMLSRVEASYWWPSIYDDIKRFIQSCGECKSKCKVRRKFPIVRPSGSATRTRKTIKLPLPPRPVKVKPLVFWDKIGLELVGPFGITSCGNQYILTVTCQTTQWAEAHALPTGSMDAGIRFLADIFLRYGFPHAIVSYMGEQVRGILNQVCELVNSEDCPTASYHPQCLYTNQRLNLMLDDKLLTLAHRFQDWDLKIEQCLYSYRRTPQGSSKKSPYHLVFSHDRVVPSEIHEPLEEEAPSLQMVCEEAAKEEGETDFEDTGGGNREDLHLAPIGFSLP